MDINKVDKTTINQTSVNPKTEKPKDTEFKKELGVKALQQNETVGRSIVATLDEISISMLQDEVKEKLEDYPELSNKIFSNKKFYDNKRILSLINAIQCHYDDFDESELELRNEYLNKLLDTPEILEDKDNRNIIRNCHYAIHSERDIKNLSDKRFFDYIKTNYGKTAGSILSAMEDDTYILFVNKDKDFHRVFIHMGDNIEVLNETVTRNHKNIHKKMLPNGEYIVSRESKDGSYRKTHYDNNGVQTYSEVVKRNPSTGQYSITGYKRGLEKSMIPESLSSLVQSGEGNTSKLVERNFVTDNGTKISYTIVNNLKYFAMNYHITDKDGNNLLSMNRTFRRVNQNRAISTLNADKYEIEYTPYNKITVTKNGNETITLDKSQLDFGLSGIYRNLPGDALFKLKKYGVRTYVNGLAEKNNACYVTPKKTEELKKLDLQQKEKDKKYRNSICMSSNLRQDVFGFLHEMGHALGHNLGISSEDEKLRSLVQKELKEFNKQASSDEFNAIEYFISTADEDINEENCISEIIAETNALACGILPEDHDCVNDRGIILQKYFPETIAYITNKFL